MIRRDYTIPQEEVEKMNNCFGIRGAEDLNQFQAEIK